MQLGAGGVGEERTTSIALSPQADAIRQAADATCFEQRRNLCMQDFVGQQTCDADRNLRLGIASDALQHFGPKLLIGEMDAGVPHKLQQPRDPGIRAAEMSEEVRRLADVLVDRR